MINFGSSTMKQLLNTTAIAIAALTLWSPSNTWGQIVEEDPTQLLQLNTITTAVPFLMIAPDSRSGAMGDVGVALSPDANSMHWNPAKMAFSENEVEMSLSYAPWLRALVDDMNLAYVSSVRRLNKRQAYGVAPRFATSSLRSSASTAAFLKSSRTASVAVSRPDSSTAT